MDCLFVKKKRKAKQNKKNICIVYINSTIERMLNHLIMQVQV